MMGMTTPDLDIVWARDRFALPIALLHRNAGLDVSDAMLRVIVAHVDESTPHQDAVAQAITDGIRAGVDLGSWPLDDIRALSAFCVAVGGDVGEELQIEVEKWLDATEVGSSVAEVMATAAKAMKRLGHAIGHARVAVASSIAAGSPLIRPNASTSIESSATFGSIELIDAAWASTVAVAKEPAC